MNRITFPLRQNMKRDTVANLQAALEFLSLEIDEKEVQEGRYGRSTAAAVRRFQEANGLEESGKVDEETAQRLNAALDRVQVTQEPASQDRPNVARGRAGGERFVTMNKEQLLALYEMSRQTPKELRDRQPELYAQVRAQADEQLRISLAADFADASKGVREHIARIDLAAQGDSPRDLRQVVTASFQTEGVPEEVAREGLGRVLGSESVGRLVDPLQPDIPLEMQPLFQAHLAQAKTYLLGDLVGLTEAKTEMILSRGITVETLNDVRLGTLVEDGELDEEEAGQIGLAASLFHLTDGDIALAATLRRRNFSRLGGRPIRNLRDLARLRRRDWEWIFHSTSQEPPQGMDAPAYAALLRRRVAALYPTEALLANLQPERPERIPADLARIEPLLGQNQEVLRAASFDGLDTDGMNSAERRSAQVAFDRLKRLANSYPGLRLEQVLDNEELDLPAKEEQLATRSGWFERIQEKNPGVELLGLDYTEGSSDQDELNFDGLGDDERRMVINTLKAYQRTYAITPDVDDARAVLAAGYHSAMQVARVKPVEFAQATGLEENRARRYHEKARTRASAVTTHVVTAAEVVKGELNYLSVGNLDSDLQDYLRRLTGYDELFGNQAYCRCEHCSSVLSPAAYFVDLMKFVETNVSNEVFAGELCDHVLNLYRRRPDLWTLPLTCQNTDQPVPTLEIINEILENYIAQGQGYEGPLTDRAAVEQVVYQQILSQFTDTSDQLSVDSFQQPFWQPLERLHVYLGHFDRKLSTVARRLGAPADVVASAALKLSPGEYRLITEPNYTRPDFLRRVYGINFEQSQPPGGRITEFDVQELLHSTGLSREELDELLQTYSINPPGPAAQRIQILAGKRDPTNSVQNDIERIYNLTWDTLDRIHRFVRLWRRLDWRIAELDLALGSRMMDGPQGINVNALARLADLLVLQERFQISVEETLAFWGALPRRPVAPDGPSLFDRLFNLPSFVRTDGGLPNSVVSFVHAAFRQAGAARVHPSLPDGVAPGTDTANRLVAGLRVSDEDLAQLITFLADPLGANLNAENEDERGFLLSAANLYLLYSHARLVERLRLSIADCFQLLDHAWQAGIIPAGHISALTDLMNVLDLYDWQQASAYSLDDLGAIIKGRVLQPAEYPCSQDLAADILAGVEADHALVFADTVLAYLPGVTEDDSRQIVAANAGVLEALPDGRYRLVPDFDPAAQLAIPAGVSVPATDAREELLKHHPSRIIPVQLANQLDDLPVEKAEALLAMLGTDLNDPALAAALRNTGRAGDLAILSPLVAEVLRYFEARTVARDILDGVTADSALVFADTVLTSLTGVTEADSRQILAANAAVLESLPGGNYRLSPDYDPTARLTIPTGISEDAKAVVQEVDVRRELLDYHPSRIIPSRLASLLNLTVARVEAQLAARGADLNDPALARALRDENRTQDLRTLTAVAVEVLPPAETAQVQAIAGDILDSVADDNPLVFADTVLTNLANITDDESRRILAANASVLEILPDGYYRLVPDFDPAASLNIPAGVAVQADAVRNQLLDYHPSRIIPSQLTRRLEFPLTDVVPALLALGINLYTPVPDLTLALRGTGRATDLAIPTTLLDDLLPLTVLFQQSAFDAIALDFIRSHSGSSHFGIDDYTQITVDNIRRASVYATFADTAREERFTPDRPPIDALDVQQVLASFDTATGFAAGAADVLARVLRTEIGQMRTLLADDSLPANSPDALGQLARMVDVARYLGVGGETLRHMLSDQYTDLVQASNAILGAFRAKYSTEEEWREKIEPYDDRLRSRQRDALTDYLIHSPNHPEFTSRNDLYHHFLIDVSLEGCARTSRLVAAISSLQLYVHRCLMSLEQDRGQPDDPHVAVDPALIPADEWSWRKNYRVWEANRKVFLFPENYIEPELRDNKTPLFEQLESTLLQQEINEQTVLDAYAAYMNGFEEIARLKIAGSYHDLGLYSDGWTDVLHLFGVTPGDPPSYYYRTAENLHFGMLLDLPTSWSPWRKIDVQIPVRKVAPVVHQNRLYVFWLNVATTVQNKIETGDSSFIGYKHMLALNYTSLRLDGTWTSPQKISMDALHGFAGVVGDGALPDPLEGTNNLRPRFDPWRTHSEPLDGYTLTGYRWEQVYPQTLPDQPLFVNLGTSVLASRTLTSFGHDTFPKSDIDFYRKRLNLDLANLLTPSNSVIDGMLYVRPVEGNTNDSRLHRYSRPFRLTSSYAISSFHKERRQLEERGWTQEEISSFESTLGPALLQLRPGTELEVVNGKISEGLVDVEGDLFLLSISPFVVPFPIPHRHNILRRIGTTLSTQAAEMLFTRGIDGLLDTGYQLDLAEDAAPIQVIQRVSVDSSAGDVDFAGPYGVYYREIFFHIPFLIANHLNSQGRFPAAQRWYQYTFNPTAAERMPTDLDPEGREQWRRDRNWRYREFRNRDLPVLRQILTDQGAIAAYKRDPFNPHAIARLRISAYQKAIVMKYIDNLLDWGDSLFAQFTTESLVEATMLYVMATDILGERPAQLGDCGEDQVTPRDYATIGPLLDEDSDFLIEVESYYLSANSYPVRRRQEIEYQYTLERAAFVQTPLTGPDLGIAAAAGQQPAGGSNGARPRGIFRGYGWNPTRTVTWERRDGPDVSDLEVMPGSQEASVLGHEAPQIEGFTLAQDFSNSLVRAGPVFCFPANRELLRYWDRVEHRLSNIRNCRDITGALRQPALFAPEIDPRLLVRARAAGLSLEDVLNAISGDLPPYRFTYLVERARQFAGTVQAFGAALLSALEKKDVEELNRLQTGQRQNLLRQTTRMREWELDAAKEGVELVERQEASASYRQDYYQGLMDGGLSAWEVTQQVSRHLSGVSQIVANILSGTAGVLHLLPQLGAPTAMKYGGHELGNSAKAWADMLRDTARMAEIVAASAGLEATFHRREEGWEHQRDLADHELKQLEKQRITAEIRQNIAQRSLELHEQEVEQLEEVFDFYAEKFSSMELYTWLSTTLQRIYRDAYNNAFAMARLAEQAFRFERGEESGFSLGATYWEAGRAGLLAGDQLLLDLQNMERRYIETNYRNQEINQSFSLTQIAPEALIALRENGRCDFTVGELFFDLFYPGQYRRRINSVRLTIPCTTGPYTNVSARLRLLESWLRYEPELNEGLRPIPPRRSVSIATSTAQNDAGVFELNFRDERYMPFEGAGAVSRWQLSLPRSFRQFDYGTISDVIIHISYTAEEDDTFRSQVEDLQSVVEGTLLHTLRNNDLARVFNLRHEFSNAFHRLVRSPANTPIRVEISDKHFPIFLQGRNLSVTRAMLALEVKKGQTVDDVALTINGTAVDRFEREPALSNLFAADLGNLFSSGIVGNHLDLAVTNAGDLAPVPPANNPYVFDTDKLRDIILYVEYNLAQPGS